MTETTREELEEEAWEAELEEREAQREEARWARVAAREIQKGTVIAPGVYACGPFGSVRIHRPVEVTTVDHGRAFPGYVYVEFADGEMPLIEPGRPVRVISR